MHRTVLAALTLAAATLAQQPSVWLPGAGTVPQTVLQAGNTLHVFTVQSGAYFLTQTILYHRSLDGGRSFEPGQYLATNLPNSLAGNTNLVGDDSVLIFSIGTTLGPAVIVSTDDGATWSAPIQITAQPRTPTSASLLFTSGVVFAVWTEPRVGPGDVYTSQSFDGGLTWTPDVRIDTDPVDFQSSVPQLFGDLSGVYVEWSEWYGPIRWQVTFDLGASWLPVPRQPGYTGSRAATGTIVTASLNGQLQYSLDGAATWTPTAFQPGPGTGPLRFAMDGAFGVAAWRSGLQVVTAETVDYGMTWTPHGVIPLPGLVSTPTIFYALPAVHGTAAALGITYQTGSSPTPSAVGQVYVSGNLGSSWRPTNVAAAATGPLLPALLTLAYASRDGIVACSEIFGTVRASVLCGSQPYGAASPGSGGIEPRLIHTGVPALGQTIQWTVDQCLGGAPVVIGYSFAGAASLPFSGINILLAPPFQLLLQFSAGALGIPGAGITTFACGLPALPVLIGAHTWWQAAVLDVGMPLGFAATAGAELWMN